MMMNNRKFNIATSWIYLSLIALLAAACAPTAPRQTPFAVTLPAAGPVEVAEVGGASNGATAVPTAQPLASRTPTRPPTQTFTPSPTSTITPTATPTQTPSDTPPPSETPTPIAINTQPVTPTVPGGSPLPTWTPPPPDPAVQINDHYRLRRPIAEAGVNWIDRTYPYGGTSGGRYPVHLGVEFVNPRGTPILAAADGTVVFAGDDSATLVGPSTNYYGRVVVLQHNFSSPQGQPVFTLYGHMDSIEVQTGQAVTQGATIGRVGDTGIAIGPHLHFEVRVGDAFSARATRNPELWIFPYRGFGTLAGRVTDSSGNLLYDVSLQVKSTDITRYAFSYADASVNGDDEFSENFTLGDLPANYYEVSVNEGGRTRFRRLIYVYPDRTTWIDVRLN